MPSQQQRDEGDTGAARRGPNPLACEMFQGINTVTTRCGVPDQQMYWCDGFIPLAPRNLRVIPGIGSALYTAGGGVTVVCFYFYNIGSIPYMVVFLSDGSAVQVRTTDGATTTIAIAGTIPNPAITTIGVAQYGSQYLIVSTSTGYGVWDGSNLYVEGTLAPGITITNPGSGYISSPSVQFSGGSGIGATGSATVAGGSVTNAVITNPGSGYKPGDTVSVSFVGGQQTGSGASLTAHLSAQPSGSGATVTVTWVVVVSFPTITTWQVQSIAINIPGSGYSSLVVGSWNNPGPRQPSDNQWVGTTGQPAITVTESGGAVASVVSANQNVNTPTSELSCWNTLTSSPQFPTITISDPASGFFYVSSVTGTPSGTNYSPSTKIVSSGGGSPVTQATITPVIVSGVITGVNIINGGSYGSNTPPTLAVSDISAAATGTVSLMPFGISGNTVETYAGHVWVAKGPVVSFTAPGSVSDFASSDGGGTFTSSDSFLRVGYTRLIQTNGFLFLIGDSSMNYISGVQTNTPSGGNPTTTFTNNNSDPETGTPYPASVTTIGQDIFLANQNGIYVSTGGTFEKKSEALDGVYNSAPGIFNGQQLSAAKALIHGKLVWMVLVPVIDPIQRLQMNKLFMFNQRYWWASEQDVSLTFIQSQEINSVFTAYGTDGTKIYPLFQTPSTAFTKYMQTRLWDTPAGYDHVKTSVNVFSIAQFLGAANLSYQIFVDTDAGISAIAGPYTHTGVHADERTFSVLPTTAVGQVGVLTGMSLQTSADDLVIVSVMLQDEVVQYRA